MFHRITGFDILTDLGLDGRGRFVMNTTSRAPRRCSSRFGMVPGDAVFPSSIISDAIFFHAGSSQWRLQPFWFSVSSRSSL